MEEKWSRDWEKPLLCDSFFLAAITNSLSEFFIINNHFDSSIFM